MALSILYCGECDKILAASPELDLVAECLAHSAPSVQSTESVHRGYRALRLADAEASAADLADLEILAQRYAKPDYAARLEPLAGSCP
jgi:hypothetical protein